jgi:hypothetical protein
MGAVNRPPRDYGEDGPIMKLKNFHTSSDWNQRIAAARALPKALHEISVAPSIWRAKS